MARKTNCKKLLYVLLALFLLVITIVGGQLRLSALAETVSYTSALDDLQKDSTFNTSTYPDNAKDYSIKVIQIAEGVNGELFLYTYQPCQKTKYLIATEINMSLSADLEEEIDNNAGNNNQGTGGNTGDGNTGDNQGTGDNTDTDKPGNGDGTGGASGEGFGGGGGGGRGENTDTDKPGLNGDGTGGTSGGGFGGGGGGGRSAVRSNPTSKLYGLTLINTSGVFGKYKVDDFTVSTQTTRYYNITSISRNWDKTIDEGTGNNNTLNAKSFPVGKLFCAKTVDGKTLYHCTLKDVIEIRNPYHDFLRYSNGFKFLPESCDGHYIAFSTNRQIERLIEAEVYYKSQSILMNNPYGEPQDNYVKLSDIDEASNEADGWFAVKHTWKRIESVKEFIANENLTTETKAILQDKQWVLRFAETKYGVFKGANGLGNFKSYTDISEVRVLRLEFETDGKVYNLGAVSDAVSGDSQPGNVIDTPFEGSGFFGYVWNCLVKLFDGKASVIETVVAVVALAVALFVVAVLIWFGKLIYRLIFK